MTEKRFTLNSVMNFDYGILDNEESIGSLANICDLLNELAEENEQLKSRCNDYDKALKTLQDLTDRKLKENEQLKKENYELHEENEWLFKCVENQSALIHELDNTIMAYNMERNITIKLTEKDLKTLDKALSYYTHQKVEE